MFCFRILFLKVNWQGYGRTHSLVFFKKKTSSSLWKLSKSSMMQTTLPLGSFFFVFTSHSFCVFELPLVLDHYYGGLSRSFDTLPVMSNSTFTSVMSGSISFRLLLLHFHYYYYYGVCVSGSTPFRLSLLHFDYGVCPVRRAFDYHLFHFY